MFIDLQLKFLQSKIKKKCIYHDKLAENFCYKTSCFQSPYLCSFCDKQKVHTHNDSVGSLLQFLKAITLQINNYEFEKQKIDETGNSNINQQIKQLTELLKSIQKIERQIMKIINESKERIKKFMDIKSQNVKKQLWKKLRFYKNPNLLLNKLISQNSTDFLFQLKKSLQKSQPTSLLTAEKFQNQIDQVKANIKSIVDMHNINPPVIIFNEQHHIGIQHTPKIQIFLNKIYELPIIANKIYSYHDKMIVCGQKTFLFDLNNKTAILIQPTLIICSTNSQKILLGISAQNILLFYSEQLNIKKNIQIIKNNPTSLATLYISTHQIFAIIGYEDGQLDCSSFQEQKNYSFIKKHNKKINNISVIESEKIIITSSQDGRIGLYKYKLDFGLLKIQFICFLVGHMEGLAGHQIYMKQVILYNLYGNIKIIDYTLNQIILQSNFSTQKSIVDMVIIPSQNRYFLLTVNKNEKQLKIWNINYEKCHYQIQNSKLFFNNPNINKNSMFVWKNNLWLLKQASPEIHVASILLR